MIEIDSFFGANVSEMRRKSSDESSVIVSIDGRLDFARRKEFNSLCEQAMASPAVRDVTIDLSRVTYLDSAALGMLLILRDKAKAINKSIRLVGATGMVADVLKIAHFEALFAPFAKS